MKTNLKTSMKKLAEYFFKGFLLIIPIAITLYILKVFIFKMDSWLNFKLPVVGRVPGLGFIVSVTAITLLGYLANKRIMLWIMKNIETMIQKVPFVRLLYNSIKDLIDAFMGQKKMFNKPVMVKLFENSDAKILGFITSEELSRFGIKDHVVVYFPQSFNFAGQTALMPLKNVTPLIGFSSTELMTFIVSAGVTRRREQDAA